MTNPQAISIEDFTYSLPEERIAKYPLAERDASKLLIYKRGIITQDNYRNIADYIPEDALLVFNNTKVVEARLIFQKSSGASIEIFCLAPHEQYADMTSAMLQKEKVLWQCLIGGASKWKHGQLLEMKIKNKIADFILTAKYIEKQSDHFIIELTWNQPDLSFAEVLHNAGAIPLPPYFKRKAEPEDFDRYQTIYAQYDGSVAAPTAGLHFTDEVFEKLKLKNIQKEFITLHVGAGTFKPVKSGIMKDHEMHQESFSISKHLLKNIIGHLDKKIIGVGTTSLRTLESLYRMGSRLVMGDQFLATNIDQWEIYSYQKKNIPVANAMEALLDWMEKNNQVQIKSSTQILIAPGYNCRIADGLITNFHQPQSTLLLLVAAFIGNDWRKVYDYALENEFRFLSYGDGNLLWKNQDC